MTATGETKGGRENASILILTGGKLRAPLKFGGAPQTATASCATSPSTSRNLCPLPLTKRLTGRPPNKESCKLSWAFYGRRCNCCIHPALFLHNRGFLRLGTSDHFITQKSESMSPNKESLRTILSWERKWGRHLRREKSSWADCRDWQSRAIESRLIFQSKQPSPLFL